MVLAMIQYLMSMGKTLAEMTLEEKSNISHRKIAAVKLVEMLNEHKV